MEVAVEEDSKDFFSKAVVTKMKLAALAIGVISAGAIWAGMSYSKVKPEAQSMSRAEVIERLPRTQKKPYSWNAKPVERWNRSPLIGKGWYAGLDQLPSMRIFRFKFLGASCWAFPLAHNVFLTVGHMLKKFEAKPEGGHFLGPGELFKQRIDLTVGSYSIEYVPGFDLGAIRFSGPSVSSYISKFAFSRGEYAGNCYIVRDGKVISSPTVFHKDFHYRNGVAKMGAQDVLEYDFPSESGDCGLPVFRDIGGRFAIIGVHIAGKPGAKSYAQTVGREELLPILDRLGSSGRDRTFMVKEEITDLHPKSVLYGVSGGRGEVVGSLVKRRRAYDESQFYETRLCGKFFQNSYVDPCLKVGFVEGEWKDASSYSLKKMESPAGPFPEILLRDVSSAILTFVKGRIDVSRIIPVDVDVALNGVEGVSFVKSMNMQSSSGYPQYRVKSELCPIVDGRAVLDKQTIDEVEEKTLLLNDGGTYTPVATWTIKDEPVSEDKKRKNAERTFTGIGISDSILVRKSFLTMVAQLQTHGIELGMPVGSNATGSDWGEIHDSLMRFGLSDRTMAGDFRKFDKGQSVRVLRFVSQIFVDLLTSSGNFTPTELIHASCLMESLLQCAHIVNGDIVIVDGTNPSGNPLTVIINNFVNLIYCMVAFCLVTEENPSTFFEQVAFMLYGDDSLKVSSNPRYNQVSEAKCLAEFNVEITNELKQPITQEYVNLYETSFLQRSFRRDTELSIWCAPLADTSLARMLNVGLRSKMLNEEEQLIAKVESFTRELWQHGRERYNEFRLKFRETEPGFEFPTYDVMSEAVLPSYVIAVAQGAEDEEDPSEVLAVAPQPLERWIDLCVRKWDIQGDIKAISDIISLYFLQTLPKGTLGAFSHISGNLEVQCILCKPPHVSGSMMMAFWKGCTGDICDRATAVCVSQMGGIFIEDGISLVIPLDYCPVNSVPHAMDGNLIFSSVARLRSDVVAVPSPLQVVVRARLTNYVGLLVDPRNDLSLVPRGPHVSHEEVLRDTPGLIAKGVLWKTEHDRGHMLLKLPVSPSLCMIEENQVHLTPLSLMSGMHENWKGSFTFTLRVSCPKVTGSLRIVYAKDFHDGGSKLSPGDSFSTNLDLSESQEVSFSCKSWNRRNEWIPTHNTIPWSSGSLTDAYSNGMFYVIVDSPLLSQKKKFHVDVCVSVRANSDLEFKDRNYAGFRRAFGDLDVFASEKGDIVGEYLISRESENYTFRVPQYPPVYSGFGGNGALCYESLLRGCFTDVIGGGSFEVTIERRKFSDVVFIDEELEFFPLAFGRNSRSGPFHFSDSIKGALFSCSSRPSERKAVVTISLEEGDRDALVVLRRKGSGSRFVGFRGCPSIRVMANNLKRESISSNQSK